MNKKSPFILAIAIISSLLLSIPTTTLALDKKIKKEREAEANKIMKDNYWGKGLGTTYKEATRNALADLQSRFSVTVSQDVYVSDTIMRDGQNTTSSGSTTRTINTSTGGLLTNTKIIILDDDPKWEVVSYVNRDDVYNMRREREDRMRQCFNTGLRCEKEGQIGEALHNLYWASCLLNSLPNAYDVKLFNDIYDGTPAISAIQGKMNDIFAGLDTEATSADSDDDISLVVKYKGERVTSICLTYDDGTGEQKTVTANNGVAKIHLSGEKMPKSLRINYAYEGLDRCNLDNGLGVIVSNTPKRPFSQDYDIIALSDKHQQRMAKRDLEEAVESVSEAKYATEAPHYGDCEKAIKSILKAIKEKNYESVREYFTPEGYETYQRLLIYGKVKLIGNAKPNFFEAPNGRIICRAVPMEFKFSNNHITFNEDVTFTFTPDHRIEALAFGLDSDTREEIFNKDADWSESVRMAIATFLENYKTAFALERIDYIRGIFDDYATIVTGTVTQRATRLGDGPMRLDENIEYTVYNKNQYIERLTEQFKQKRFINIRFADVDLKKLAKGGDFFGMRIKQDYFSDNYADTGYLFLMVNMNDPDAPLITVRAWQPHRDPRINSKFSPDDPRFGFIYEGNFK